MSFMRRYLKLNLKFEFDNVVNDSLRVIKRIFKCQ